MTGLVALTSCGDDSDDNKTLFPENVYTAENGLELNYSNAPMIGKSVKFEPNDKGARLTLYSTFDLSAMPLADQAASTIAGPGVIPGSPETVLDVKLKDDGDNARFSGKSENQYCKFEYEGIVSNTGLKLNINNAKLNDTRICNTWELAPMVLDDETYEVTSNPIHVVWESGADIDFLGSPLPPKDLLKVLMVMPLLNDMSVTIPDALTDALKYVSFLEDGNIVAYYKDVENGATDYAPSSMNMAQYVLTGDNSMLFFLNPQAVIAEAATPAKSSEGEAPSIDIDALMGNIMAQLIPMLPNGVPMAYNLNGDKLNVYLDTNVLLPLLKQNVLPLLRDEALVKSLVDMVAADPDMAFIADMLPGMITSVADVIEQTTRIEVGLAFDGFVNPR